MNIYKIKFLYINFLKKKSFRLLFFLLYLLTVFPVNTKNRDINFQHGQLTGNKSNQKKVPESFPKLYASINWEKVKKENIISNEKIFWQQIRETNNETKIDYNYEYPLDQKNVSKSKINSLNRSIVFNDSIIGPDISWMFPSGFKWSETYKFDISARGHNTRIPDPPKKNFFGWNDGDAVGLISFQFLHFEKSSFGFNLGVRSMYEGDGALGGSTSIGEGMSAGFRWDYELSNTSGISFGGEQLLHFDGLTDTGRNFYLTASKAWWSGEYKGKGEFPLYAATAGFGTGRMAIGTVRGLCADFLGGSGTEVNHKRNLCWAPVFSLASVWNEKLSTFFEYNGRFFLLGSSIAPYQKVPIRGTFALILSDHIDNYKFHNSEEMNWVFQLSLGF